MRFSSDTHYLLISVVIHLILVLFMTIKVVFFPNIRPDYVRSVRVDFVALPDKDPVEGDKGVPKQIEAPVAEKPQTKAAEKKAEEKPKAPTKKEVVINDKAPDKTPSKKEESKSTKDQQASAIERLNALSKIKKMREAKEKGPEGVQYKGNQVSEGTALTGVEKLQHDQYLEKLDVHIKKNWQLPEWLAEKNLTASLLVRFDETGVVLQKKLIKSSGNVDFDKEAMQAVEASAPLPAPPETLISYFKVHGIELRFPE